MNFVETMNEIIRLAEGMKGPATHDPPTSTEMSDEEFLAQYAKLGEEWLPEWQAADSPERIAPDDDGDLQWQWKYNFTVEWSNYDSSHYVLAAFLESHSLKKLREMEKPIWVYINNVNSVTAFRVAKTLNGRNYFLNADGSWEGWTDAEVHEHFRHALIAAIKAAK